MFAGEGVSLHPALVYMRIEVCARSDSGVDIGRIEAGQMLSPAVAAGHDAGSGYKRRSDSEGK